MLKASAHRLCADVRVSPTVGKAESQRSSGDSGDSSKSTNLDNRERRRFGRPPGPDGSRRTSRRLLRPEADEFVPTDVAVEIIEGFEGDDPKVLVRTLGDAAQGSGEQGSSSGTGGEASGSA
jgi:hypothetical protein